jgi:hypothetical protein
MAWRRHGGRQMGSTARATLRSPSSRNAQPEFPLFIWATGSDLDNLIGGLRGPAPLTPSEPGRARCDRSRAAADDPHACQVIGPNVGFLFFLFFGIAKGGPHLRFRLRFWVHRIRTQSADRAVTGVDPPARSCDSLHSSEQLRRRRNSICGATCR